MAGFFLYLIICSLLINIRIIYNVLICIVKKLNFRSMETAIVDFQNHQQSAFNQTDSESALLLTYLELGNTAGKNDQTDEAIDHYVNGLQIAKRIQNKPRIQQFSNLILTYI